MDKMMNYTGRARRVLTRWRVRRYSLVWVIGQLLNIAFLVSIPYICFALILAWAG